VLADLPLRRSASARSRVSLSGMTSSNSTPTIVDHVSA
jgi:hypothetical protein